MNALSPKQEILLRELISKHALSETEETIISNAVDCCTLLLGREERYNNVGNSRYGGDPDLPPFIDWPQSDGDFYGFLMQVNLADIPDIENNPLPSSGLLYFFILDDEDSTSVKAKVLLYQGDMSQLRRVEHPPYEKLFIQVQEMYANLNPHEIETRLSIDLPGYGSQLYRQLDTPKETHHDKRNSTRYCELMEEASGATDNNSVIGQILGTGSIGDFDIRENAVLLKGGQDNKIYDTAYRSANKQTLEKAAEKWMLLWRIDSDFTVGVNIWDAGSFYTAIRKDDLARAYFENTYIQLETC
jgi:uncharacterized protein YwqG